MDVDGHASCELLPVIYTSAFSLIIPDCFSMSPCTNVYLYVYSAGTWVDPLRDIMSSVTAGLDWSDRVTRRVSSLVLISLDSKKAGIFRCWVNICYHNIHNCSRNDCLMKRFVYLRLRLFRLAARQFAASRSAWADWYVRDDVLRKFAALQMPWGSWLLLLTSCCASTWRAS